MKKASITEAKNQLSALIAGLQAFLFAILTAIYIGGAVESH